MLPTSGGKPKLGTLGGTSYVGGRMSLVWQPDPAFEAFISADYTKESSEAGALVTRFAGNAALIPLLGMHGAALAAAASLVASALLLRVLARQHEAAGDRDEGQSVLSHHEDLGRVGG